VADQSVPAESHDPRIDAALHDYLERVDKGETLDPATFVAEHPEIARELRSLIDAEVQLRKLAGHEAHSSSPDTSTRSFALHGQETIAPQAGTKRAADSDERRLKEQFGRYRIVKVLGQGAMGTVYLAEDTQLKRQVALKTPHFEQELSGELLERLYREARAAATLRHPNICPVHDVGEIDGTHYISMAYIEGHPLSAFIRSSKPQPERQILIIVRKLAQALQEAHEHKVVHRDLKPANIMVDKRGEPLIMDFGLARHTRPDEDVRLTHSGTLVGTPAYMSPEQVDGESTKIGPLTDEYSLGVILYELLTGQLPFRGSMMAVLGQIVTKEAPAPSQIRTGLDPRIDATCLKMMAKHPSDRFASLSAVAEELAKILRNPGPRSPSAGKSTAGFTLPTAAEGHAASGTGASRILKSQSQKSLTASDLESLEELARKCWARHDYDQVIRIAERIPEEKRTPGLQTLLEKARTKTDEIAFLIVDIDEAVRLEDGQTALKKAEALLKIKPGHHRALEIQEQFGGEGHGGPVRLGPKSIARAWRDGGWIPWSALAFGLAVVGVVYGVIVWMVNGTAIIIKTDDPHIHVEFQGQTAFLTVPGKQKVSVKPGDGEFTLSYEGLETVTKQFSIKRNETKILDVSIADKKLVAEFEGEVAPSASGGEKAKNVGSPSDESKPSQPATSAAPVAAANPAQSDDGFVPLFNGKDKAGWQTHPSQPGNWRVENGILIGSGSEKNQPYISERSHLYTERGDFKNFHLRVEARINDGGNSGLYFRSTSGPVRPADHPTFPYGYEAQIDSTAVDPNRTGSLYAGGVVVVGVTDTLVPAGQWFTEEVIAQGNQFVVKVNGQTTSVYRDEKEISASGYIALQQNNPNTIVEFRKIEIKELRAGAIAEASTRSSDGYAALFNGKDLTGWTMDPSRRRAWHVDNGILRGGPAGEASVLYSDRENYKNFRLRVEARLKDNESSELWVRTQIPPADSPDKVPTAGYEIDLREPADSRQPRTGSIWAVTRKPDGGRSVNGFGRVVPMVQPGVWFTLEVVAQGKQVYVLVNGEVAYDTNWVKRDQFESGRIAIEQHVDAPSVEFRKIEIKELPDSPVSSVAGGTKPSRPADKDALIAPFDETQAQTAQQEWSARLKTPIELVNKSKMRLRLIPPGQFQMGANDGPDFVQPAHPVQITRPFYIGTYEVTRAQFAAFMANHAKSSSERLKTGWRLENIQNTEKWEPRQRFTWRSPGFAQDGNHPVIDVSWDDAQEFCAWLSHTEGKTYRLPTEAEWEYACRAGTTAPRYNGGRTEDMTKIGNFADATVKEKFPEWRITDFSDGFAYTSPVGQFLPNSFGLYDTLGNAMEWCSDWYGENYYKNSPVADPPGPPQGKHRVARGGSFATLGDAAGRWSFNLNHRSPSVGLRVVCEIPISAAAAGPPPATAADGDNRRAWLGESSRFDKIADGKWRETFPNQAGHAIYFFDEVARTAETIELLDKTRIRSKGGVSVRLGSEQALIRWGGPDQEFKPLQRGQWARTPPDQDAAVTPSDDGFVPLFNGINKSGWKTHESQRGNWHVENGILIGSGSAASHLYTKRGDFKDFILHLEARINAGGNSGVIFRSKFGPAWPANKPKFPLGYEAQIDSTSHTAKTGSLFVISGGGGSGSAVVSVPASPVPAGEWFTMEVMAKAGHIVIKVNDQTTAEYDDSHFRSGHIALQQHDAKTVVEFRNIRIQEHPANSSTRSPAGRPREASFFNGRNSDGWHGLAGFWHVKDQSIVGTVPVGQKAHTFLCSDREYKDFELKFRARLLGGIGNSGVNFRSKIRDPQKFSLVGPQCEICAQDRNRKYPTGSLVSEPTGEPFLAPVAADVDRIFKLGDFNDFEIRCVGQHVRIKVNGQTTVDADFPSMPDQGLIGWQMHGGNPPREVTFKDIEFTDLSAAKGPVGGL
jgi:serine/threonine protein kinase/formylglycine-generating enzyme required for sulfatase activity